MIQAFNEAIVNIAKLMPMGNITVRPGDVSVISPSVMITAKCDTGAKSSLYLSQKVATALSLLPSDAKVAFKNDMVHVTSSLGDTRQKYISAHEDLPFSKEMRSSFALPEGCAAAIGEVAGYADPNTTSNHVFKRGVSLFVIDGHWVAVATNGEFFRCVQLCTSSEVNPQDATITVDAAKIIGKLHNTPVITLGERGFATEEGAYSIMGSVICPQQAIPDQKPHLGALRQVVSKATSELQSAVLSPEQISDLSNLLSVAMLSSTEIQLAGTPSGIEIMNDSSTGSSSLCVPCETAEFKVRITAEFLLNALKANKKGGVLSANSKFVVFAREHKSLDFACFAALADSEAQQ